MTTHKVLISDGASLHVKVLGGDSPTKPLLIALHGAPGLSTHAEPEATFNFLQSKFRIIIYDARGSGYSSLQPPYTNERWVADVDELRIWAGADKFVLAGGSYGGFVSLDYALKFQGRLLALILRDTWAWGTRGMMRALKTVLTSDKVKVDPERQFRVWTGILKDDQDFADAVAEIGPLYAPPGAESEEPEWKSPASRPATYAATQNAAFSQEMPKFDVRSRLKDIKVPTLVIVGRHDLITPVSDSEEISNGIPNSQLAIFENSGHTPGNDEPEAFRERVRQFLSSVESD
ncbi:alpha/beta hydrolase fold protein [Mollisia scopiformis]|uniref:Alpha/beta hydrolase fold protein n=1 Tax=Mollisia scopiformis TaxID=149040 RepID=A0A194XEB8_MOLSC|nr:alpha/beta hydrolase fold protein [Mollisia scopiformis]KUJ18489.1 alpha/beta hydrolase fold protein [Mollisia scopiformis]